jgi:hypothetical protein
MPNAATALAALLKEWHVPKGNHPESVRGINEAESRREFWRDQAQAVQLVLSVDNIIRGIEAAGGPTAMFAGSVVSWYEAAIGYSVPWQSTANGHRHIIEDARLENLEAFGVMLDQLGTVAIDDSKVSSLRTTLEEAKDLAANDPNLTPDSRRYMWGIIIQALDALDEIETFGTHPVRAVLLELSGAANVQADVAEGANDQPTAGRWRGIRDSAVRTFTSRLALKAADGANRLAIEGLDQLGG